jgi:hypothetical protein
VASIDPKPVGNYPLSRRLDPEVQPVALVELLGRQRRAEVGVLLTHQRQDGPLEGCAMAMVTRAAALLGRQPRWPGRRKGLPQTMHLPLPDTHQSRRCCHGEPAVPELHHDPQSTQLALV